MKSAPFQVALILLTISILAAFFRLHPDDPDDLYARWVGSKEVLAGRDPYRVEVSQATQLYIYGHKLTDYEIEHGADQQRFAYPAYVAFLIAPLLGLGYDLAHQLACGVFACSIALSIPFWLNVAGWRPPPALLAIMELIVLLSPIASRGLRLNQLALLVALFFAAAALAIKKNQLLLAGILLALATAKPQLAFLPVCWFSLWSLSCWRKRWKLLASFGFCLVALICGSSLADRKLDSSFSFRDSGLQTLYFSAFCF